MALMAAAVMMRVMMAVARTVVVMTGTAGHVGPPFASLFFECGGLPRVHLPLRSATHRMAAPRGGPMHQTGALTLAPSNSRIDGSNPRKMGSLLTSVWDSLRSSPTPSPELPGGPLACDYPSL